MAGIACVKVKVGMYYSFILVDSFPGSWKRRGSSSYFFNNKFILFRLQAFDFNYWTNFEKPNYRGLYSLTGQLKWTVSRFPAGIFAVFLWVPYMGSFVNRTHALSSHSIMIFIPLLWFRLCINYMAHNGPAWEGNPLIPMTRLRLF